MEIIFTKHAETKLKRADYIEFNISKTLIRKIVRKPQNLTETKYHDFAAIRDLDKNHVLRVIYVIINQNIKVITFHIARKGRYEI